MLRLMASLWITDLFNFAFNASSFTFLNFVETLYYRYLDGCRSSPRLHTWNQVVS